jgi:hypothetical protein
MDSSDVTVIFPFTVGIKKDPPRGKGPGNESRYVECNRTASSKRLENDCFYWLVVETATWRGGSLNRARLIAICGERRAQSLAPDQARDLIN